MFENLKKKLQFPNPTEALQGREKPISTADVHFVNHRPIKGPYPDQMQFALFGMGCFWGVERLFWQIEGVWVTAVGYAAGLTPNPTYEEVCTGQTGHNEVVRIVYDPEVVSYQTLLKTFWENHNPTQGMRQGNDVGTQYRSGIYTYDHVNKLAAEKSRDDYNDKLKQCGLMVITTEILDAPPFYFAEHYHQQYLAKNPNGYCSLRGTGVVFPLSTDH